MEIDKISIENYKSIRDCQDLKLERINVLVGANGVGKTNFISFFKLLKKIADSHLQDYIAEQAGINNLLYFGVKNSGYIRGRIEFSSSNAYEIILKPSHNEGAYFEKEQTSFYSGRWHTEDCGSGHVESNLEKKIAGHIYHQGGITGYVKRGLSYFEIYHFHDTSKTSPIKQSCSIHDNRYLKPDGSNLAAFLYFLEKMHPIHLRKIEQTIRQIAPFFDKFHLEPLRLNKETIRLEWFEKNSDMLFGPHHLSDGTIRMIALSTLLLQPEPRGAIIIDEPELGLHPAAITLLASLIKKCSHKSQLIISTQSVTLVNQFKPEEILVTDRKNDQTVFARLKEEDIKEWLDDYGVGDAWEKNVFGGRP